MLVDDVPNLSVSLSLIADPFRLRVASEPDGAVASDIPASPETVEPVELVGNFETVETVEDAGNDVVEIEAAIGRDPETAPLSPPLSLDGGDWGVGGGHVAVKQPEPDGEELPVVDVFPNGDAEDTSAVGVAVEEPSAHEPEAPEPDPHDVTQELSGGPFSSAFVEDELSPDSEIRPHEDENVPPGLQDAAPDVVDETPLPVPAVDPYATFNPPPVPQPAAPQPAAPIAPPAPLPQEDTWGVSQQAAPHTTPQPPAQGDHTLSYLTTMQEPVFVAVPETQKERETTAGENTDEDTPERFLATDSDTYEELSGFEEAEAVDPNIMAVIFPKEEPLDSVEPSNGFDPSKYLNFDTHDVEPSSEEGLEDSGGEEFGVSKRRTASTANPEAIKALRELNAFKNR